MSKPTIIISGTPSWLDTLRQKISETYQLTSYTQPENYVARLADDSAALIIVDGAAQNWRFWTTTPKASPATRRIPLIVVSDDAALRTTALTAGADLSLTPDTLLKDINKLAADYARVPDPDWLKQLDCECAEELPELGKQGIAKFNAGEYYPQHDLFEEQWVKTSGPVRDLYRAILQVGVAYFQITRRNQRGALKMLLRSVQWLAVLPDVCQGVDVRQLREDSYRVRAELERLGESGIDAFDLSLLKPVQMIDP